MTLSVYESLSVELPIVSTGGGSSQKVDRIPCSCIAEMYYGDLYESTRVRLGLLNSSPKLGLLRITFSFARIFAVHNKKIHCTVSWGYTGLCT